MDIVTKTWKKEKLQKNKGKQTFKIERLKDPETTCIMSEAKNKRILETGKPIGKW